MTIEKRSMFFLGNVPSRSTATPPRKDGTAGETLISMDSGRGISFAQGLRNVLVLGQTGSGKTHNVLTPALEALFNADCGGLVIDPKGTLGEIVRAAAAACGRADDVLEFGTSPTACKTNLFTG